MNNYTPVNKYLRINKKDIALIQFILEGYEGMATVTTVNPREARIVVSIMPDFVPEIEAIIDSLKMDYLIENVDSF